MSRVCIKQGQVLQVLAAHLNRNLKELILGRDAFVTLPRKILNFSTSSLCLGLRRQKTNSKSIGVMILSISKLRLRG